MSCRLIGTPPLLGHLLLAMGRKYRDDFSNQSPFFNSGLFFLWGILLKDKIIEFYYGVRT